MPADAEALVALLRRRGVATPRELQAALSISQPTLSRLVAKTRAELVVFGRARGVRYAAREPRSTFFAGLPLHRVRENGKVERFGTLHPIVGGQTVLLREHGDAHLFSGLPWFLEELRPQGFLGRLSARALSLELQAAADPRLWTAEQVVRGLLLRGDNLPGDLLPGDVSRERYLRGRLEQHPHLARSEYADLIEAQLTGAVPGSSAGGEQPKFTCRGRSHELLVKYSPPLAESAAARRWGDLLRCEELALDVLRASQVSAAHAEYVEVKGRAYLEVKRFDRTDRGRIAVATGTFVDAEFVGSGAWVPLVEGLAQQGTLSAADAETVRVLHIFGGLIGNTDMHLGNLAFFADDYERFRLAPVYDMLPMALRPTAHGELPRREPPLPLPTPEHLEAWNRGTELAHAFFARARRERGLHREVRGFFDRLEKKVDGLAKLAATLT